MEKLKSILKLELIRKTPKENKMAYLLSVGMGAGMGILMGVVRGSFFDRKFYEDGISIFAMVVPIIIVAIILLLILFKWFSVIREDIKARIICIILMSISFIHVYIIIIDIYDSISINQSLLPLDIVLIPIVILFTYFMGLFGAFAWTLQDPSSSPFLIIFIYSGIFIVVASYLATKGIINLRKRIVVSFLIGLFIYMVAIFPLLLSFMISFS